MTADTICRWRTAHRARQAGMINHIMGGAEFTLVVVAAVCAAMTVNTGTGGVKHMTRGVAVGSRFECPVCNKISMTVGTIIR